MGRKLLVTGVVAVIAYRPRTERTSDNNSSVRTSFFVRRFNRRGAHPQASRTRKYSINPRRGDLGSAPREHLDNKKHRARDQAQ